MSNKYKYQQVMDKFMWLYNGKEVTETPPNVMSFIYRIIHLETGKWYIGRKGLYKTTYKQVKGKKRKVLKDSDWKDYWSSSVELQQWAQADGESKFKREILIFTETASATTYAEEAILYMTGALFDPLCLNGNIRAKIFKSWFANKETDLHSKIQKALYG